MSTSTDRRRRFLVMSLVGSILLFLIWYYSWNSLIEPLSLRGWKYGITLFLFVGTFILQVWRWADSNFMSKHYYVVFWIYASLGFVTHLFLGALMKDISFVLIGFVYEPIWDLYSDVSLYVVGLCILAAWIGARTAMRGPKLISVDIPIRNLPDELVGHTIVQISDLHVGPIINKKYVSKVVEMTNSIGADLIAITGDLADGSVNHLLNDLEPLRDLKSRLGTFYVNGNHEYYWNVNEWETKVKDLGMNHLHNSGRSIEVKSGVKFWIGGVPDHSARVMRAGDESNPKSAIPSDNNDYAFKLLLAHQPVSCFEAKEAGFDIMLCGHTHAGQFFPYSTVVGFFNPYVKGLNRHENSLWVYVNVGTGFWGPPTRLLVPSEITKIRLVKEQQV